mmetsp:Transcript_27992/g.90376  ORF Transcript_27992/g.90376 Transcript_27992/m.90376 type:complete len:240 (-) Transcript_27992:1051-1770(-)
MSPTREAAGGTAAADAAPTTPPPPSSAAAPRGAPTPGPDPGPPTMPPDRLGRRADSRPPAPSPPGTPPGRPAKLPAPRPMTARSGARSAMGTRRVQASRGVRASLHSSHPQPSLYRASLRFIMCVDPMASGSGLLDHQILTPSPRSPSDSFFCLIFMGPRRLVSAMNSPSQTTNGVRRRTYCGVSVPGSTSTGHRRINVALCPFISYVRNSHSDSSGANRDDRWSATELTNPVNGDGNV